MECDGCIYLEFEESVSRYDVNRAVCCDPDKKASGARRVVAASGAGMPQHIMRPVWCRSKIKG